MKYFTPGLLAVSLVLAVGCGKRTDLSRAVDLPAGRTVWNHLPMSEEKAKQFQSVVKLEIGDSLCSSTYIGNGVLLTAYHCVKHILEAEKGKEPEIYLSSSKYEDSFGPLKDYTIDVPKMEDRQKMSSGKNPQYNRLPDLAVIRLQGDDRKTIDHLPAAKLGSGTLGTKEKKLVMCGYGIEDTGGYTKVGPFILQRPPTSGNLNWGTSDMSRLDKFFYYVAHHQGDDDKSVAMPGDSGGPLLRVGKDGELRIYGVLSTLGLSKEGGFLGFGQTVKVENAYSRLDREPVQKWLAEMLKN